MGTSARPAVERRTRMFTVTASAVKPVVASQTPRANARKSAEAAFVAPVAATAMAILLTGPAHAGEGGRLGLELKNGTGLAPGKYEQPFYDPRPVVTVQTDGPGDVTKDEARILPNRQIGPGACKLITGAPCVDFQSGK